MSSDPTVALLRGINLGGHRVKMDRLREAFEEAGMTGVTSYIASGNVAFDATDEAAPELESRLADHLGSALGFPVPVFLRSLAEVAAIGEAEMLISAEAEGFRPHVIFLRERPGDDMREALDALQGDDDRFVAVGDREIAWLRRGGMKEAPFPHSALVGALGDDTTTRNLRTVRKMVAKFGGGG